MNVPHLRGTHLTGAGHGLQNGTGLLARLVAGGVEQVLRRIDAGLATGSIEAEFPDGSIHVLGGRAPGFAARIIMRDWRALLRLASGGSVGWYNAWEAGEWESPDPVTIFALFMANAESLGAAARAKGPWRIASRLLHRLRRNTRTGAAQNIAAHYDLGNDFYASWLDPTLSYSSGMFSSGATTLQDAQLAKIDALAVRLALDPGACVLEIGCGWGYLARRLATAHGANVTAISLSEEQLAHARHAGAADDRAVRFVHCDYRDAAGNYDAIVSVEMVEALGRENWPVFMDRIACTLKPGGRAALQFISIADAIFERYADSADFIQTYIFPGGLLIRTSEFRALARQHGLSWQDQTDFGQDYAETLLLWRRNFDTAVEEGRIAAGFDRKFIDLWRYYLMYCEGGFRGGGIDVHQVTLVKPVA
ncbi:cyclopropane-fatty-acyl-phospholipid synthase family protein [Croceicoccus sp. F390]|uniref:Cyclopropane-fatty-acyl-phospholipid synthase family protein n=1 Tax=Croceicoccus esteveae TaxID=3075597 RepID=A0ABU2ZES1_9SPHN|nr:cyclopropane-fatty-acyl-phospholipid synthase family protein [Croceicoccus sp. F390]MDT0574890.1 cyclopropane-fatty-acyl-phospholipid synthase family protein [Croceicoccus sp. F390]